MSSLQVISSSQGGTAYPQAELGCSLLHFQYRFLRPYECLKACSGRDGVYHFAVYHYCALDPAIVHQERYDWNVWAV